MSRAGAGAAVATVLALSAAGMACSSTPAGSRVVVVVSAPVSTSPWIARSEVRGAQLAAGQLNAHGGVRYGGRSHRVVVEVRDNGGSPRTAVADARAAVAQHAAVLITDGVGASAVAAVTDSAHLPVFVVFDGGASFISAAKHPTLFRLAPADQPMAVRLADYLAAQHPRVALLTDDTGFGTDGAAALTAAFTRDRAPVVSRQTAPAGTGDVRTQVLQARRAGATILVVWAGAPIVAEAVASARSAGWNVPIWTGPTGEDPLVRQQLAAHPTWLDGVGFVSFRITAEVGPAPFAHFRSAYEHKYGVDKVGVTQGGKSVVQPPDWAMFSYDTVNLVAAALAKSAAVGEPLLQTLEGHVVITGANGDERGFLPSTREGVSPDDMYFAQFTGFVFAPVRDDLLSENLPSVPQTTG
ncbi:MAG: amino acid ABC transporter substrate-binding protein [Frankiales bacterium]|nr:amino acid ABC transporter substrate-binding protein [Frankiales bacterium]